MTLKPIEWLGAQQLLTDLVQALSPLTVREVCPSLFLTRRFLLPQEKDPSSVGRSHHVKLLSALHALQQEVGEWVEEPPQHPPLQPSAPEKKTPLKQETSPDIPPKKLEPQTSPKTPVPVTRQAQELIHQVQAAIAKLCHSEQMQAPQEEVLLRVLHELKPKLDRIVETLVSREIPTSRFCVKAVPVPKRQEQVLQKIASHRTTEPKESSLENLQLFKTDRKAPENKPSPLPTALPTPEKTELHPQLDLRFVTLPGAPHTPEPKRLILNDKRRKRKGLWFQKDRDSSRDP